ncbi:hypothetical protein QQ020_28305 [Fulvivirgaceae bacterium BMA12]|uniref:Uncharacterized protein n=1 Tax=Agaribacillus aureus TaxID=3051825 RepID=A0ABT8LE13_9BACT|nr:hypothetical protein [Fulvivirgaceae bacterium BMA12]
METLKLHSSGQDDHIQTLNEKYEILKKKLEENKNLTASEKKIELEKLNNTFEKEKRDASKNLY